MIKVLHEKLIEEFVNPRFDIYDTKEHLMYYGGAPVRHDFCANARIASYAFVFGKEKYYDRAKAMLKRVLSLQNTDENSPYYGMWSYALEERLEDMYFVDYNVADFIAKSFLDILYHNPEPLSSEELKQMCEGLRRAIESGIRRNIAPDYTNISIGACLVQIAAGEKLKDERFFNIGKQRLKKLLEYTRFNTGFSEYNSSNYALLNIEDTSRMLDYFKDSECKQMAEELNEYAWEMLTVHFNTHIDQLTPPQSRSYINLEEGKINALIYLATDGKHGNMNHPELVMPPWMFVGLKCPESCLEHLTFDDERWIDHTY